jgi:hypothetical protein
MKKKFWFFIIFLLLYNCNNNKESAKAFFDKNKVSDLIFLKCYIDNSVIDSVGFNFVEFDILFKNIAIFPIITKTDTQFVFIKYSSSGYMCRINKDTIWKYKTPRCGDCQSNYDEIRLWNYINTLEKSDSIQEIKNYFNSRFNSLYSFELDGINGKKLRMIWGNNKLDTIVYFISNKNEIYGVNDTEILTDTIINKYFRIGNKIKNLDTTWYYWGTEDGGAFF